MQNTAKQNYPGSVASFITLGQETMWATLWSLTWSVKTTEQQTKRMTAK